MQSSLQRQVRHRAKNRCEYCLIHQRHDPFYTFPIDHIIAEQHGGPTVAGNLALSCLRCNLHKGPNIAGKDPLTKKLTPLFHPRRHKWSYHFQLDGPRIMGVTAIGRTTVKVLAMNHPDAVMLRESIIIENGAWP
jgi:hypothetical protein